MKSKFRIVWILVILVSPSYLQGNNNSKIKTDTIGKLRYPSVSPKTILFLLDSFPGMLDYVKDGVYYFIDDSSNIRLKARVKNNRFTDTSYVFDITRKLAVIMLYADTCFISAYYYDSNQTLSSYFEFPTACNFNHKRVYTFENGIVRQILTFENNKFISKIENKKHFLRKESKRIVCNSNHLRNTISYPL